MNKTRSAFSNALPTSLISSSAKYQTNGSQSVTLSRPHVCNDRKDLSGVVSDAAARAAVELRAGRSLKDAEWSATRAKLLEFAGILRAWDLKTAGSRRGNVEVLCRQEP